MPDSNSAVAVYDTHDAAESAIHSATVVEPTP